MGTDKPAGRGPETLRVGFNANPAQTPIPGGPPYDFRTNTNTFVCPMCDLFAVTAPFDITTNISVVKVGLNFKFGG